MAGRNRVAVVCRDCGEVGHFELAGNGSGLVSCAACGLVSDLSHLRAPAPPRGRGLPGAGPGPSRGGAAAASRSRR